MKTKSAKHFGSWPVAFGLRHDKDRPSRQKTEQTHPRTEKDAEKPSPFFSFTIRELSDCLINLTWTTACKVDRNGRLTRMNAKRTGAKQAPARARGAWSTHHPRILSFE